MAADTDDVAFRAGIEARLAEGERLTAADGVALHRCDDLSWLGGLANARRVAAAGDVTTFIATDAPFGDAPVLRYGRGVSADDRIAELCSVRDALDAEPAGGTTTGPTRLVVLVREGNDNPDAVVSPAESMKLFALARLLLDNVADLGCDLGTHSASTGALLQHFGSSALLVPTDGFDATGTAELIWDAGLTPVHAGADGAPIHEYGPAATQARRRAEPQSVFA